MKSPENYIDEAIDLYSDDYEEIESEITRVSKLIKEGNEVLVMTHDYYVLAEALAFSTHRTVEKVFIHSLVEYAKKIWPEKDLSSY